MVLNWVLKLIKMCVSIVVVFLFFFFLGEGLFSFKNIKIANK